LENDEIIGLTPALGVISQIVPYSYCVHPNVSAAVGGGQPDVVDLFLKPSCMTVLFGPQNNAQTTSEPVGAIIWHRDQLETHFTLVRDLHNSCRKVYSIKNDSVEALRHINATVILNPKKYTFTITFRNGDRFASQKSNTYGSSVANQAQITTNLPDAVSTELRKSEATNAPAEASVP
jgi:hypothetical protein